MPLRIVGVPEDVYWLCQGMVLDCKPLLCRAVLRCALLCCAVLCCGRQVIELIKRKPKESPAGDFIPEDGTLQGSLALQNVVFAYPGRPTQLVLNGLSLAVNPGERGWGLVYSFCFW